MPAAQRTITINRPVEDVFAFFTDPNNETKWRTHLKEVSAAGPVLVGTTIHQVVTGPAGRGIPADVEVTGYEPGTRYAFRVIAGPIRPVGEFAFSPNGTATTVSLSLAANLSGLKRVLLSRSVQGAMDGEMRALDRAKAVLEAS
ncbi:SRPBCC family protein [Phycicoccus sp. SLBN-51]|uniref:SRPBCC family protein n=1 Tax=Phycicoccus sp. SLBN-51 TaxID=2768447 RepID=UPI00116DBA6A|nr:SRPBCC family protein [Phycicoccus sp. SLBN-51]TQJ52175.1 polyketide cyclase/dehydrase/lipid transport protein [Phycicoccus sp. SLBN-51]